MREAGPGRGRREQTGGEEEQVREITSRQEQAEAGLRPCTSFVYQSSYIARQEEKSEGARMEELRISEEFSGVSMHSRVEDPLGVGIVTACHQWLAPHVHRDDEIVRRGKRPMRSVRRP